MMNKIFQQLLIMKMTEHQRRIWQNMIDLIQSYIDGETEDFYAVVGKLEGALDASDIRDIVLINRWYDFWTPLEIRRAVDGAPVDKIEAIKELKNMRGFLMKHVCP